MNPDELRESLEGMTFRHASDVEAETNELRSYLEESIDFLPPEDVAAMEKAGEYYEDARRGAEYVLEGGDAREAIGDLNWAHAGYGIDRDELVDHPATVIAQALSDQMNSSRITSHKDPVVRAPKDFR